MSYLSLISYLREGTSLTIIWLHSGKTSVYIGNIMTRAYMQSDQGRHFSPFEKPDTQSCKGESSNHTAHLFRLNCACRVAYALRQILSHIFLYLETCKKVTGKQCRPRSDATSCGICLGPPLFANSKFHQK